MYEKLRSLKVRRYAVRLVDFNEYMASFPWDTMAGKIVATELNEIILNSLPNIWYKQAYLQGFDCESISFRNAVNLFDRMVIVEKIY